VLSRIGLISNAHLFAPETNLWSTVSAAHAAEPVDCVLAMNRSFFRPDRRGSWRKWQMKRTCRCLTR
jgi:thymidine kinase